MQHITFATDNIFATLDDLKARGFKTLPITANYCDDLIARTGGTTATTTQWLRDTPAKPYDAVVVSLGVNDVTRQVPLTRWLNQTATFLDLLTTKFSAKRIYTVNLPPMGEFPVLPQPLRHIIGLRVDRFDAAMAQYQATRPEVTRLKMDLPNDPTLMASDGYHPGPKIYALWAEKTAKVILEDFEGLVLEHLDKI